MFSRFRNTPPQSSNQLHKQSHVATHIKRIIRMYESHFVASVQKVCSWSDPVFLSHSFCWLQTNYMVLVPCPPLVAPNVPCTRIIMILRPGSIYVNDLDAPCGANLKVEFGWNVAGKGDGKNWFPALIGFADPLQYLVEDHCTRWTSMWPCESN